MIEMQFELSSQIGLIRPTIERGVTSVAQTEIPRVVSDTLRNDPAMRRLLQIQLVNVLALFFYTNENVSLREMSSERSN